MDEKYKFIFNQLLYKNTESLKMIGNVLKELSFNQKNTNYYRFDFLEKLRFPV